MGFSLKKQSQKSRSIKIDLDFWKAKASESRQFIDKTTHRHGFWRQFIDTIEDNSSTLFEDNSSTHLFEYNLQS